MAGKTKGYGQRGMRREIEGGREGIVDRGRDELSLEECRGSLLSGSGQQSTGIEGCRRGCITVWNGRDEISHTHSITHSPNTYSWSTDNMPALN